MHHKINWCWLLLFVLVVKSFFFKRFVFFDILHREWERRRRRKNPKKFKTYNFSCSFLVDMVIKMFLSFYLYFFKPIFLEGEKNLYFFRFVVPANLKKKLVKKDWRFCYFLAFCYFVFIECNISKFDWLGFGFLFRNNLTRILI